MSKEAVTKTPSSRADEWHIRVPSEMKRRFKANAALHGLTLAQNLARLVEQDEAKERAANEAQK